MKWVDQSLRLGSSCLMFSTGEAQFLRGVAAIVAVMYFLQTSMVVEESKWVGSMADLC